MSQETTINDGHLIKLSLEQRRMVWFEFLLAEHDKTRQFLPKVETPIRDENYPEWYDRAQTELVKAMIPMGDIKKSPGMTPRRMGMLTGRVCMHTVWMFNFVNNQIKTGEAELKPSLAEQDLQDVQQKRRFTWEHGKWIMAMQQFAILALSSSIDQSYEDMSDFLLGFANAFSKKPKSFKFGGLGNTNSEIYRHMLMYWKIVAEFKTVPQLHAFLEEKLGKQGTGELKRIEKICQRIGWPKKRAPRTAKAG
jgi:hypothetical protein